MIQFLIILGALVGTLLIIAAVFAFMFGDEL